MAVPAGDKKNYVESVVGENMSGGHGVMFDDGLVGTADKLFSLISLYSRLQIRLLVLRRGSSVLQDIYPSNDFKMRTYLSPSR
jgi:hypothetical protein